MMKYKAAEEIVVYCQTIKDYQLQNIFDDKAFRPKKMDDIYKYEYPGPWYVLGYKIMAGLSIFYITPPVYEAGVAEGVIEPVRREPDPNEPDAGPFGFCEEEPYDGMLQHRSHVLVNRRMHDALAGATVPFLKKELERINAGPKRISIKVYKAYKWWKNGQRVKEPELEYIRTVEADLETGEVGVSENKNTWENYETGFFLTNSYTGLLNEMAKLTDQEYKNCRDFYEVLKDHDFYRMDKGYEYREKYEIDLAGVLS